MTYTAAQIEPLAQRMVQKLPGLNIDLARVWIRSESGVGNNPLGVTSVQGGVSKLNTYSTPTAGIDAAIALIKSSSNYAGIRSAIGTRNTTKQAQAIIASPWHSRNSPYYTRIFTEAGFLSNPNPTTPSGGASTPITASPAVYSTPNVTLPFIDIPEGKILDKTDITYIVGKFESAGTFNTDPMTSGVSKQLIEGILNLFVGKPWTKATRDQMQASLYQGADLTAKATNPLGISTDFDLPGVLMFLGVILVGITFVLTGGLIALRKK